MVATDVRVFAINQRFIAFVRTYTHTHTGIRAGGGNNILSTRRRRVIINGTFFYPLAAPSRHRSSWDLYPCGDGRGPARRITNEYKYGETPDRDAIHAAVPRV